MANHGVAKLPWSIDPVIMELFAKTAMQAAFGGFYVHEPEHGSLGYVQSTQGGGGFRMSTQVWSDGPKHVEMRHGCSGLDLVAQEVLFRSVVSCFGAPTAWDDGEYAMELPGVLKLLPFRRFNEGCSAKSLGIEIKGLDDNGHSWLMTQAQQKKARKLLDPIFFNSPDISLVDIYQPGPVRDEYLRMRELDVLNWGSKLDWAGAVEAVFPGGEGVGAKRAFAIVLPSAALGRPCPDWALSKVNSAGLERALAVAMYWSRVDVAKQIYGQLCTVSTDIKGSEDRVWAQCCKFFEKKAKNKYELPWPDQKDSANALREFLCLSRMADKPAKKLGVRAKRSI